jgi:hypothetical protein
MIAARRRTRLKLKRNRHTPAIGQTHGLLKCHRPTRRPVLAPGTGKRRTRRCESPDQRRATAGPDELRQLRDAVDRLLLRRAMRSSASRRPGGCIWCSAAFELTPDRTRSRTIPPLLFSAGDRAARSRDRVTVYGSTASSNASHRSWFLAGLRPLFQSLRCHLTSQPSTNAFVRYDESGRIVTAVVPTMQHSTMQLVVGDARPTPSHDSCADLGLLVVFGPVPPVWIFAAYQVD